MSRQFQHDLGRICEGIVIIVSYISTTTCAFFANHTRIYFRAVLLTLSTVLAATVPSRKTLRCYQGHPGSLKSISFRRTINNRSRRKRTSRRYAIDVQIIVPFRRDIPILFSSPAAHLSIVIVLNGGASQRRHPGTNYRTYNHSEQPAFTCAELTLFRLLFPWLYAATLPG